MTAQLLTPTPDVAPSTAPTRSGGGVFASLREALRSRRSPTERAARRAVAREIASFPATRGAVAVLPATRRHAAR